MTVGAEVREWGLAVDFGTTATAAVTVSGGQKTPLALDEDCLMSSSVYARPDGVLLVGMEADNQAAYAPDCHRPTPKRDVGKNTVRLGSRPYTPVEMIAATMGRVLADALAQHGGVPPAWLVLTHPVRWSRTEREKLAEAMRLAARQLRVSVPEPLFVSEPEAAARSYSIDTHHDPPKVGQKFAVYDLGGGTFDVAVLERTRAGFLKLNEGGINRLGGFDFDHRLYIYLGDRYLRPVDSDFWKAMMHPTPTDPDVADKQRRMRTTVQLLKVMLSTHTSRSTSLPGPNGPVPVLITREEFEALIAADIDRTIEDFLATLDECGLSPSDLAVIYRVGGASRTPLVGRRLEELGAPVYGDDQPKLVVANGASVTERSAVPQESAEVRDDVERERSRLLWETAQAKEERGDSEAAADDYRNIAELGHPDWKNRARNAFQAVGLALVKQNERRALRSAFDRTTGALRSARDVVNTSGALRSLGLAQRVSSIVGSTWRFVGTDITVAFMPGGYAQFSDKRGGRWHQNGSRLTFDSNKYEAFTMVVDGDGMQGEWRRIRGSDQGKTSPVELQRISGNPVTEETT